MKSLQNYKVTFRVVVTPDLGFTSQYSERGFTNTSPFIISLAIPANSYRRLTSVVEAKICSWTDVLSDPKLQRSMHGSSARPSEQYDMLVQVL